MGDARPGWVVGAEAEGHYTVTELIAIPFGRMDVLLYSGPAVPRCWCSGQLLSVSILNLMPLVVIIALFFWERHPFFHLPLPHILLVGADPVLLLEGLLIARSGQSCNWLRQMNVTQMGAMKVNLRLAGITGIQLLLF